MSPAPPNPLEQVSQVLQPNTTVPLVEKVSVLRTFSSTLEGNQSSSVLRKRKRNSIHTDYHYNLGSIPLQRSAQILSAVPLGLFYNGFSVEDDKLTTVLCEVINKILSPFTYDHIVSAENKVKI